METKHTDDLASRLAFRPLSRADLPLLRNWLARPHWTEWWGDAPGLPEVEAEYGAWIDDPRQVQPYIALLDGEPFGYIQSYVAMGSGGAGGRMKPTPACAASTSRSPTPRNSAAVSARPW